MRIWIQLRLFTLMRIRIHNKLFWRITCTKFVLLFQGSNNELQYVNVKALNEWDSRYVRTANDLLFGTSVSTESLLSG
jgi:hypothetical protein